MNVEELSNRDLMKALIRGDPDKYGHLRGVLAQIPHEKKPKLYDLPDLSGLPPGQCKTVQALIGGGMARTYPEAADLAGMSEGTMLTHINRVRRRHSELYEAVRPVRLAQLADRHGDALSAKRAHSAIYFRKRARNMPRWFR